MSRHVLPPCSVDRCKRAAGAIINGELLCGEHAVEVMQNRALLRQDGANGKRHEG